MRFLTSDQIALLRAQNIRANLLITFWLDEGTWRFCDDAEDLMDGPTEYIGANALLSATDISMSGPLAAEGVSIVADGTRAYNAGISDPAFLFNAFLETDFHQRRVDLAWGFRSMEDQELQLIIPAYAGKINNARLIDDGIDLAAEGPSFSRLEINLDSLAMKYKRKTFRTRSNDDHAQITGGSDKFYSYIAGITSVEETLYWGREAPKVDKPIEGNTLARNVQKIFGFG